MRGSLSRDSATVGAACRSLRFWRAARRSWAGSWPSATWAQMRLASVRACSAVSLDAEAAELQLELPPVVDAPVQVERIRAARQHQQVKAGDLIVMDRQRLIGNRQSVDGSLGQMHFDGSHLRGSFSLVVSLAGGVAAAGLILGVPLVALAELDLPVYAPDRLPPELAARPATKPGSRPGATPATKEAELSNRGRV
jgi:hypothetical protein